MAGHIGGMRAERSIDDDNRLGFQGAQGWRPTPPHAAQADSGVGGDAGAAELDCLAANLR